MGLSPALFTPTRYSALLMVQDDFELEIEEPRIRDAEEEMDAIEAALGL